MYNWEELKNLREQGYTLQEIGDKYGVTRERIRQLLATHYGTTRLSTLVPRMTLAKLMGHSDDVLLRLEREGLVKPIHHNAQYLYDTKDIEQISKMLIPKPLIVKLERICQICGAKFYLRPSHIRPSSPGKFCSNKCKGVNFGYKNRRHKK